MEWIALALLVLMAAVMAGLVWSVTGPWRLVKARRVVVNLKSGQAIQGLLVRQSGPLLFLAEAQLHEGNNNPVPIDGQAVVERPGIDFIQIL
jgi:hypothetical protein